VAPGLTHSVFWMGCGLKNWVIIIRFPALERDFFSQKHPSIFWGHIASYCGCKGAHFLRIKGPELEPVAGYLQSPLIPSRRIEDDLTSLFTLTTYCIWRWCCSKTICSHERYLTVDGKITFLVTLGFHRDVDDICRLLRNIPRERRSYFVRFASHSKFSPWQLFNWRIWF
jgi:hypothetical protein